MTSFQTCCDWVAIISLVFSLTYYLCADGYSAFRNSTCKPVEITVDESVEYLSVLKVQPEISFMMANPRFDTQFSSFVKQRILK